jgi:hypothetical protein
MGDNPDPSYILVPGLLPLVSKVTGEIEYVVAHLPEVAKRLEAMTHNGRYCQSLTSSNTASVILEIRSADTSMS